MRERQVIALIGMMGSGKSTIGASLAAQLGIAMIDSDHEIEKLSARPIHQIFKEEGEVYFRELEESVIKTLLDKRGLAVLATGGGSFINPKIREILLNKTITVWLKVDSKTIMQRIGKKNDRPILDVLNKEQKILEILEEREKIYRLADIEVDSTAINRKMIVEYIISELEKIMVSS